MDHRYISIHIDRSFNLKLYVLPTVLLATSNIVLVRLGNQGYVFSAWVLVALENSALNVIVSL